MPSIAEQVASRRTFAIISHPDAGKTTLTEKLLLYTGSIQTAGSVKGKASARHAVSDWMDIEKERGISVTSSVMQFQHGGYCINILDTPGHQDFSEDTYRTLMAADSAVMVIDGAKGVEPQTRKLFRVCALRHIPIFTFINKMDRETRDPLELCEEVERELGIDTYAVNWPIGCGKEFQGVYDREKQCIIHFTDAGHAKKAGVTEITLDDPALATKHRYYIFRPLQISGLRNPQNLFHLIMSCQRASEQVEIVGKTVQPDQYRRLDAVFRIGPERRAFRTPADRAADVAQ